MARQATFAALTPARGADGGVLVVAVALLALPPASLPSTRPWLGLSIADVT